MIGVLYVASEELRHLSDANVVFLVIIAAVIGGLVGWFPHIMLVLILLVGSFWLIYDGFTRWQQLRLVEDTTTEPVRAIAAGRTEVYGTCQAIDKPITRPFADEDCVLAYWEVEEYHDDWETLASGMRHTPFVVDDGTGRIRVDPQPDATIRISERNRNQIKVGVTRFSSEPDPVVEFLESRDDVAMPDIGLLFRPQRRYTEHVIPPGEEVYVLGGASPRADAEGSNAQRLVLTRDEATDEFLISDRPQEEFVDFDRTLARNEIGMGVTLVVVFLASYAVRRGGAGATGAGIGPVMLIGLGIFLYGLYSWDW